MAFVIDIKKRDLNVQSLPKKAALWSGVFLSESLTLIRAPLSSKNSAKWSLPSTDKMLFINFITSTKRGNHERPGDTFALESEPVYMNNRIFLQLSQPSNSS